jgi:tetratricopeptide (TPR) repeat protein
MTDQPKKQIFISHATKDDALINQIIGVLERAGFTVWVDHDGGLTPRDENWDKSLREAIKNSHAGIFVMTENALQSAICGAECLLVQQLKKPLFVIHAENCKPENVWLYIKMIQYANIVDNFDVGMNALIRAMNGDTTKGLPTAYTPQITGLDVMTGNLPYLNNPLRGRDSDVVALQALLADKKAVIQLIGVGGLGKSRLSAEIARAYLTGAVWHRCSSISTAVDVIASLRSHLVLQHDAPLDLVLEQMQQRKLLVVIDNAEDVTATNRVEYIKLFNQLVNHHVPILFNSREEWDDQNPHHAYLLSALTDRANAVQLTSDFCASNNHTLTHEQLVTLAEKGRLHPKLIELAVGQLGNISYDDVIRRLDELSHKSITQALHGMIIKTLNQMKADADEGVNADALLRNLTWLQATFPETVIEALKPATIITRDDFIDALVTLRRFQFIRKTADGRYRLGELVREALGTNPDVFSIYADFYINRAKEIFYDLPPQDWHDNEDGENANDIANIKALGGALLRQTHDGADGDLALALEFATMTRRYVQLRMEARAWGWLEMGLQAVQTLRKTDTVGEMLMEREALMLAELGEVYQALGQMDKALAYKEQSLPLARALEDKIGESATLNNIGTVWWSLGNQQKALDYYEQALPLRRAMRDKLGEGTTLGAMGVSYNELGDKQKALAYYEQALPLLRAVGDRGGEATTLNNIGTVYDELGDKQKALAYYKKTLLLDRVVGNRGGEAGTCFNMGMAYKDLGDLDRAIEYVERAIHTTYEDDPNLKMFRDGLMYLKRKRGG